MMGEGNGSTHSSAHFVGLAFNLCRFISFVADFGLFASLIRIRKIGNTPVRIGNRGADEQPHMRVSCWLFGGKTRRF